MKSTQDVTLPNGEVIKVLALRERNLLLLLDNWMNLNKKMMQLSEEEIMFLLEAERIGRNRPAFLMRLHARFNRLRAERERKEISGPIEKRVEASLGKKEKRPTKKR